MPFLPPLVRAPPIIIIIVMIFICVLGVSRPPIGYEDVPSLSDIYIQNPAYKEAKNHKGQKDILYK
jgi:hypothetical protein